MARNPISALILAALAKTEDATLAELETATGIDRGRLSDAMRRLVRNGGVEWVRHGHYRIPANPVPRPRRERRPSRSPDSFRARLWRAMRVTRKASIGDLLALAMRDGDDAARCRHNATVYLRGLALAGYLVDLRRPGERDARYSLTDDAGPQPPGLRRDGGVLDPNRRPGVTP